MCSYDPESPECCEESFPKSRKEHICCECGSIIEKGEWYNLFKAKYSFGFKAYKTCEFCYMKKKELIKEYNCRIAYTCLYDHIVE